MELINSKYIKLDKFSIFIEIVKSTDEKNNDKTIFFQKLLKTVTKYEKENELEKGYIFSSKKQHVHKKTKIK